MKAILPKQLLLNNATLKIISIFLSYSFWYIATIDQNIEIAMTVPLCFTTTQELYNVQGPEKIDVTLKGKRYDLYALDKESLAAHINISKLLPGKHGIILNAHHLFLPSAIVLSHYKPSNLAIIISPDLQNTKELHGF